MSRSRNPRLSACRFADRESSPAYRGKIGPETRRRLSAQLRQRKISGSGASIVGIAEIQLLRHEADASGHVFGQPSAKRHAGACLLFEVGDVVRHAPIDVQLHRGQRVVQIGIPKRDQTEGPLLAQLAANAPHPPVAAEIAFGDIGDRHQFIQRAEAAADAELACRLFLDLDVEVDLVRVDLLRQNFHRLEEIQIIEALKAPLQRRRIDDVLFVDAQLAADDVVSGLVVAVDVDLPDRASSRLP